MVLYSESSSLSRARAFEKQMLLPSNALTRIPRDSQNTDACWNDMCGLLYPILCGVLVGGQGPDDGNDSPLLHRRYEREIKKAMATS